MSPELLQRAYGSAAGGAPARGVVQREPVEAEPRANDTENEESEADQTVDLRTLAQQVLPYLKTLMQVERERYGRSRRR